MEKFYRLKVGQFLFDRPMKLEEAIQKMDRLQSLFLKMELIEFDRKNQTVVE